MTRQYLTDFELMILLAILRIGDDAYGVPIAAQIEETGGRTVLLGAIYAALDRLEANGLVSSSYGDPTPERGGRAKRFFKVTAKGLKAVKEADGISESEQIRRALRAWFESRGVVVKAPNTSTSAGRRAASARERMDLRIERFFADLPADFESRSVRYVNNSGFDSEDPLAVILPHFFNHQTHHRAQVHTLLSQLGCDPPVLDLHRVLRPDPTSRS